MFFCDKFISPISFLCFIFLIGTQLPHQIDSSLWETWQTIKQWLFSGYTNLDKQTELRNFLSEIWVMDKNRLEPGRDYKLNHGTNKWSIWNLFNLGNEPFTLFRFVNEEKLKGPTFQTFINLLDNYHSNTSISEYMTKAQMNKIWLFLESIMQTSLMNHTYKFLTKKNLISSDRSEFMAKLFEIWFNFDRPREFSIFGSNTEQFSSFEHIFLGEYNNDNSRVTGLHNWIQLYKLELNGLIRFKKITRKTCLKNPHFMGITYEIPTLHQIKKDSLLLIGTSPEFEIAAYTTVFLMNTQGILNIHNCPIKLICIHKFYMSWRPKTCYPKDKFL